MTPRNTHLVHRHSARERNGYTPPHLEEVVADRFFCRVHFGETQGSSYFLWDMFWIKVKLSAGASSLGWVKIVCMRVRTQPVAPTYRMLSVGSERPL